MVKYAPSQTHRKPHCQSYVQSSTICYQNKTNINNNNKSSNHSLIGVVRAENRVSRENRKTNWKKRPISAVGSPIKCGVLCPHARLVLAIPCNVFPHSHPKTYHFIAVASSLLPRCCCCALHPTEKVIQLKVSTVRSRIEYSSGIKQSQNPIPDS